MSFHPRSTTFQPCDSYFVEPFEGDMCAPRLDAKEHAKYIAQERQAAIAEDLSRLACEELQDDILTHIEQMDVSSPSSITFCFLSWLT